ncbi:MAG: hypothetical protein WBA39_13280 [Rivularia sp. (in: cyanobacteria)]
MTVSFKPVKNFDVESKPNALAIGDFNADRKQDLVTKNKGTNLSVLLGDGNGRIGVISYFNIFLY